MEFDTTKTAIVFLVLNALGVGGLLASGVMPPNVVLMMVLPSMLVFAGVFLFIGMKFGEHRATH